MKIREVRAFAIRQMTAGGSYSAGAPGSVGGGPGVPLVAATAYAGMAVPQAGRLTPSDAPGFGLDLTLEGIEALAV